MEEIRIFNNPDFGDVRTIVIDGEPWFAGRDVCKSLGYVKPTQAIHNNVEDEDTLRKGLLDSRGIEQETIMVNESGLYSLIFGSKLDSAKKFKRWVTSEVLPSLRKTGSYGTPLTTAQQIQLLAQGNVELNQRVDTLTDRMDKFEQDLPLLPANADELSATVKKRVVEVLGGKHSNAYHDKSISQTAFLDAYRNLKRNFDARTYKNIKRCQMDIALQIAKEYQPPAFLKELIRNCNAQMNLDI